MTFVPLPADQEFFVLQLSSVIRFDAERRGTRFEDLCPTCGGFYNVIGANPVYLRGLNQPIQEGIFRSDLEFGSGPEQSPLILVGIDTAIKLREQDFQMFHLEEVLA